MSSYPPPDSRLTPDEQLELMRQQQYYQMIWQIVSYSIMLIFFLFGLIWGYYERKRRLEMRGILGRPYSDGISGGDYQTGLCDNVCTCRLCLPTVFFPCFVNGFNRAEVDNRECACQDSICQPTVYQTRQSIRTKYEMPKDECMDCITVALCTPCAMCQDTREMEIRDGQGGQGVEGYSQMSEGQPLATISTSQPVSGYQDYQQGGGQVYQPPTQGQTQDV